MPDKKPARQHILHRFHVGQKQVGDLGSQAEEHIETHLLSRFERLNSVRRFVAGWLALLALLIAGLVIQELALSGYYQTLRPVPGGIYNEGVEGRFTNANPMFATSDADVTVSRLIFAGLLKPDDTGHMVGDLASSYDVSDFGMTYTVHLRPGLTWQDGQPLTSRDVVFTYHEIQDPDVQSPLLSSWTGVDISAPDARTVVFRLPDPLASFPYNLATGIVPEHLLNKIPPADMRSADFNTVHPVGAGPFAWKAVQVRGNGDPGQEQEQVALMPFGRYHAGKPKLQEFVVQAFDSQTKMIDAFKSKQLTAMEGVNQLPPQLRKDDGMVQHSLLLRAATMAFFKTSQGVLSDQEVRQALVQATDTKQIISRLGYKTNAVDEPLLRGQLGYEATLTQSPFDSKAAATRLHKDGWKLGNDGFRHRHGQLLAFTLTADNTSENRMVAEQLKRQWGAVGAKVGIRLQSDNDFQSTLAYHDYDAVLDGISIGVDPDVFVYWDSSQSDIRSANRLNLSEYKNPTADEALEAGRTRLDPTLRIIKYRPFLRQWQQDAPAVGLYQPRLLYLTNGPVAGLSGNPITSPADRFINVQNWEIRQAKVTNQS